MCAHIFVLIYVCVGGGGKAVLKLIFYWRLKMLVVKMGEKEEEE